MAEEIPKDSACKVNASADTISPELASAFLAMGRKLSTAIAKVNQAQRELGEVKALHDKLIIQVQAALTIE